MTKILVVEPVRGIRNSLKEILLHEGYDVCAIENLTDMSHTPSANWVAELMICGTPERMSWGCVEMPWIALAEGSLAEVLTFFRAGAADFVAKPVDVSALLRAVRDVLAHSEEPHALCYPHTKKKPCQRYNIVGSAPKTVRLKRLIELVAPTEARVLVMGENGTGKELVARQIHRLSRRASGPFVEVNCAAIPGELIESELFGHVKGSFTGAVKDHKGKFEQADGGTLFLDEIGDMSLSAQAKVLRVLQENKLSRVGSDKDINVKVRVVAATNKNLLEEIAKGNFREDLYHRLSVIVIHVPSLAERKEDIPLLVNHFIGQICNETGMANRAIADDAVAELQKHAWTGNIRELRNALKNQHKPNIATTTRNH